jgi:hypothetical protein
MNDGSCSGQQLGTVALLREIVGDSQRVIHADEIDGTHLAVAGFQPRHESRAQIARGVRDHHWAKNGDHRLGLVGGPKSS